MNEDRKDTGPPRRQFVNWLLSTGAGGLLLAILYPVTRYLIPPKQVEAATTSVVLPITPADIVPNSGQIFKFGNRPGIIVRTPSGELRAFSGVCTHLACTVQYRSDLSHIWCACHNGHFSLTGANIAGPPPRPLDQFSVRTRENEIVVTKGPSK